MYVVYPYNNDLSVMEAIMAIQFSCSLPTLIKFTEVNRLTRSPENVSGLYTGRHIRNMIPVILIESSSGVPAAASHQFVPNTSLAVLESSNSTPCRDGNRPHP